MSSHLGNNTFCHGNTFSLADIAVGCALGWLDFRFPEIGWQKDYDNLASFFEHLSTRPVSYTHLNRIGKKAIICLREPSMGPVFGMKGGAAGGGYSQVIPMEDINLHFTGAISAVAMANNLLSALIDNHIHHGNELGIDARRVVWKRVIDMNDRSLRNITIGLGGPANGYPRADGFNIAVASEVMAIFCLATSLQDLKERLGKIVVAYTRDLKPILASDLKAHGAMAALRCV